MKRNCLVVFCALMHLGLLAQNNASADMVSFTEPTGWTLTDYGTYRTYSSVNDKENTFCIISVYSKEASSGNDDEDFRNQWKGIVAGHFTVIKNMMPHQDKTKQRINYLWDEANVANDKGNFFARLVVLRLNEKVQPILFLSSNKNSLSKYQNELDNFLASVKQNNQRSSSAVAAVDSSTNYNVAISTQTSANNDGLMHFNHLIFNIPQGWKATQDAAAMSFTIPVQSKDEMLMLMLLPPVTDTNFQIAGNNTINLIAKSMGGRVPLTGGPGREYSMIHEGQYAKSWQYSFGKNTISISKMPTQADPYPTSLDFEAGVYMAKINGRIERVVYLSKNYKCGSGIYGTNTSTSYKNIYSSLLDHFFFNLKFDDYEELKMKPGKLSQSGISGVWSGVSYLSNTGKYDATVFIFFDNGQVFYSSEFPHEGLRNINTLTEAALRPDHWGVYNYQNGSGTMKISSWNTIPFTIKDGKLMAETGGSVRPFTKLSSIDGATLNGTWCLYGSCISFTSDGAFIDNGVIQKLDHLPTTCNSAEPVNGKGTYEIKNHTITFHYADGLMINQAISGLNYDKGNLSTNQLFLGWYNDVLEKNRK
ncbi:MAG TPA: hypothetical protein VMT76_11755 [Puia sp.]|nr:hypothetical protein [Puia sp.]